MALAAMLAWLLDRWLLGHNSPFFASAVAIIVLGQARGLRIRRTIDVVVGVAVGVLLADIVVFAIDNTTLAVFVLIVAVLVVTTAIGAGPLLVTQGTVSALYVAVIAPPAESLVPARFLDALIGGVVALVCNQLAIARNPLSDLVGQMRALCEQICAVVDQIAVGVEQHDRKLARDALEAARGVDVSMQQLRDAVVAAREALQLDPVRRHQRGSIQLVDGALRELDFVVRGGRVLARASVSLARWPERPGPELATALRHLAAAIGYAGESLVAEIRGEPGTAHQFTDRLDAACRSVIADARHLLDHRPSFPLVMMVGQLRSITIDLLRGIHTDDDAVLAEVDSALGFPVD